jgi:Zn-dependent protease with chaperone function
MPSRKPFPEAPDNSTLHKVQPGEYGNLLERVQTIAKSLNIAAPDVWVADSKSLQAEAFPSNNVAITTATLNLLSDREQNAFLGHELGHLKNGDKDGLGGEWQVMAGFLSKGHLQEYREMQADTRSVEAAYASRLYSPDDLSSALKKVTAAGKTAGHDISAMNGSVLVRISAAGMAALPEKAQGAVNSISDSWNSFFESIHLGTHPSLEHRIENVNQQKQIHDKSELKR